MHIVQVYIHVKQDQISNFIQATLENVSNSVKEPGIARFDLLQESADSSRFILNEVYLSPADVIKHKETHHYLTWRDAVNEMMEEPRKGVIFKNLFPDDKGWG